MEKGGSSSFTAYSYGTFLIDPSCRQNSPANQNEKKSGNSSVSLPVKFKFGSRLVRLHANIFVARSTDDRSRTKGKRPVRKSVILAYRSVPIRGITMISTNHLDPGECRLKLPMPLQRCNSGKLSSLGWKSSRMARMRATVNPRVSWQSLLVCPPTLLFSATHLADVSDRDLSHLIKNPDVRPALPGPRLSSQMSETSDRQRPQYPAVSAIAPAHHWKSGYRSPVPLSPISHSAMTPSLGGTPSPTQLTFGERPGRHRHRPVAPAALSAALTDPYRSPIEVSFSQGVPMRQSHTIDNIMPVEAPRRRSTSLEGMRPSRTPSPRDAPSKRSRTHTVTSELPPSLAALALSAPIHESPSHSRQLPKLSPGSVVHTPSTDMFVALPPTLPPPRGRANERMDGHYRSHTDSTQITLQRQAQAQRRLPGPDDLLRPATDYR